MSILSTAILKVYWEYTIDYSPAERTRTQYEMVTTKPAGPSMTTWKEHTLHLAIQTYMTVRPIHVHPSVTILILLWDKCIHLSTSVTHSVPQWYHQNKWKLLGSVIMDNYLQWNVQQSLTSSEVDIWYNSCCWWSLSPILYGGNGRIQECSSMPWFDDTSGHGSNILSFWLNQQVANLHDNSSDWAVKQTY